MSRRATSWRLVHLVCAGMVLLCCACARPSVSERAASAFGLIVTQVREAGPTPVLAVQPTDRYPLGSRIIWVPSIEQPDDYRVLSDGLAAAGSPDLSPVADSIVFTGRATESDNWSIFESKMRSGRLTKIIDLDHDCIDPAYLAGSRLVFSCRAVRSPESDEWTPSEWVLYTSDREGNDLRRISFGTGSAFGATALLDGRVLFSMQQGAGWGRTDRGATALFTLNSDGTLLEAFAGSHSGPELKLRPRQGNGKVLFIGRDPASSRAQIHQVDFGRPHSSRSSVAFPLTPFSVEPLADSTLLIASPGYPDGSDPRASGIFRWIPDDPDPRALFHQTAWREIEALPSQPTAQPKNLPSAVDPTGQDATLVCYDVSRTNAGEHFSSSSGRAAVVALSTRAAVNDPTSEIELGRSIVETDGSFSLTVPADIPIRVTTLTDEGTEIASSDWFWLRPGEVRACFGCHENREMAPINRPTLALSNPVRALVAAEEVASR